MLVNCPPLGWCESAVLVVSDVNCPPLGWCESAVLVVSVGDETVFSSQSGCMEKLQDK